MPAEDFRGVGRWIVRTLGALRIPPGRERTGRKRVAEIGRRQRAGGLAERMRIVRRQRAKRLAEKALMVGWRQRAERLARLVIGLAIVGLIVGVKCWYVKESGDGRLVTHRMNGWLVMARRRRITQQRGTVPVHDGAHADSVRFRPSQDEGWG